MAGKGFKWMIREIVSGEVVEKSKTLVPEQARPRSRKAAASSPRKRDANERSAIRSLARLINCNFTHGDLWLALRYDDAALSRLGGGADERKAAAERELDLFLRRMRRELEKQGAEFKYIAATSDMDGESGELVRPHHHVIMPRAVFELIKKQWRNGSFDYQLLRDQKDYTPLAVYICRQVRRRANENRWKSSRNLAKPVVRETETHREGELRAPAGARVLEVGAYSEETGQHYIRYIRKPRTPKRGGHKEGGPPLAAIEN